MLLFVPYQQRHHRHLPNSSGLVPLKFNADQPFLTLNSDLLDSCLPHLTRLSIGHPLTRLSVGRALCWSSWSWTPLERDRRHPIHLNFDTWREIVLSSASVSLEFDAWKRIDPLSPQIQFQEGGLTLIPLNFESRRQEGGPTLLHLRSPQI